MYNTSFNTVFHLLFFSFLSTLLIIILFYFVQSVCPSKHDAFLCLLFHSFIEFIFKINIISVPET